MKEKGGTSGIAEDGMKVRGRKRNKTREMKNKKN